MRNVFYISVFYLFSLIVCSCQTEKHNNDAIKVEFGNSFANFTELIESVEYIPLETDSVHLVGYNPSLYVSGDSYYIVDKNTTNQIYRYNLSGKFSNKIGRRGRGPGEYARISGFQISGDSIILFSDPVKMLIYSPEGTLLEEHIVPPQGLTSYYVGGSYVYYFGFGGSDYRVKVYEADTTLCKEYLFDEYNRKLMGSLSTGKMSVYRDSLYITDLEEPHILCYCKGSLSKIYFDFGRYSVPDKYYTFSTPSESFDWLQERDYAYIHFFMKNDFLSIVSICNTQTGEEYGLYMKDCWTWFNAGEYYDAPFAGMLKAIKDNSLYFLIFPHLIDDIPEVINSLAVNSERLNDITEESNYVIAKINLKQR